MTDNEIVKALEHCAGDGCPCNCCVLYDANDEDCECSRTLKQKAAEIISHQQAEIEEKGRKLREVLPIVAKLKAEAVKEFAERLIGKAKSTKEKFVLESLVESVMREISD